MATAALHHPPELTLAQVLTPGEGSKGPCRFSPLGFASYFSFQKPLGATLGSDATSCRRPVHPVSPSDSIDALSHMAPELSTREEAWALPARCQCRLPSFPRSPLHSTWPRRTEACTFPSTLLFLSSQERTKPLDQLQTTWHTTAASAKHSGARPEALGWVRGEGRGRSLKKIYILYTSLEALWQGRRGEAQGRAPCPPPASRRP